ncbi:hypothetical protein [Micromonospora sp. NPDC049301]|uniref:hypothetical protein n=1 Tax=Micromonospora sp. NPDC049301 TaxID=3155723 RepID=UPI0034436252
MRTDRLLLVPLADQHLEVVNPRVGGFDRHTVAHLRENVSATALTLPGDALAELNAISLG